MSIKKDLQTIAFLKQQEQEKKTLQEQELEELEKLKKDIINLIDAELIEILDDEELKKDLLYYYFNNRYNLIDDIYNKLINIKIKSKVDGSGGVSSSGLIKYKYNYISKYQNYNSNNLKILIDETLKDYILKISREQRQQEKEEKRKQKQEQEIQKEMFLNLLIELFNESNLKSYEFYKILLKDDARHKIFYNCYIEENLKNLETYQEAVKRFKKLFNPVKEETRRKAKTGGLLTIGAIVLGIFEGLNKTKKRR